MWTYSLAVRIGICLCEHRSAAAVIELLIPVCYVPMPQCYIISETHCMPNILLTYSIFRRTFITYKDLSPVL